MSEKKTEIAAQRQQQPSAGKAEHGEGHRFYFIKRKKEPSPVLKRLPSYERMRGETFVEGEPLPNLGMIRVFGFSDFYERGGSRRFESQDWFIVREATMEEIEREFAARDLPVPDWAKTVYGEVGNA